MNITIARIPDREIRERFNHINIPDYLLSKLKSTLFDVEKRPVPYIKKDSISVDGKTFFYKADFNHETGKQMIVNKDRESFISIMSDDYVLIKNISILHAFNDMCNPENNSLDLDFKLIDIALFNDREVRYIFIAEGMTKNILGAMISPRITIINSYGGKSSFKVIGGVNVLSCTNGLMFPKTISEISQIHLGNIDVTKLIDTTTKIISKSGAYAEETFGLLKSRQYSDEGLLEVLGMFTREGQDRFVETFNSNIPTTYYDLLQSGTNVITHSLDREKESTHILEQTFIPKLLKIADGDR